MKTGFLVASLLTTGVQAVTLFHESTLGDFSDDHLNPTVLNLEPGNNSVRFTIGGGSSFGGGATNGSDADIVLFVIPSGASMTSLRVTESEGGAHFFGAEFGNAFSVQPANSAAFGDSLDAQFVFSQGSELILRFPVDPTDSFVALFQETADVRNEVELSVVIAVPEPSTGLLGVGGLALLLRRRR